MAQLGFRTLRRDDRPAPSCSTCAAAIDALEGQGPRLLEAVLPAGRRRPGRRSMHAETQNHGLDKALDRELIEMATPALERGEPVQARDADQQRQPHRRRHAVRRGRQALRPRRPAG
ncbi:MAG: hypothetical protein MZV49_16495 [Rhodopseudomonas palustris]|nr:hypothetical protein [Rhodopseudomonas palustris]